MMPKARMSRGRGLQRLTSVRGSGIPLSGGTQDERLRTMGLEAFDWEGWRASVRRAARAPA